MSMPDMCVHDNATDDDAGDDTWNRIVMAVVSVVSALAPFAVFLVSLVAVVSVVLAQMSFVFTPFSMANLLYLNAISDLCD